MEKVKKGVRLENISHILEKISLILRLIVRLTE